MAADLCVWWSLRGFEPLTACMPIQQSRYRLRPAQAELITLGGAEGIRTPDPLHAMQVRYQLRHSPIARWATRES